MHPPVLLSFRIACVCPDNSICLAWQHKEALSLGRFMLPQPPMFLAICHHAVQLLITPLNALPPVINGVLEALVSFRRLQHFLALPEHHSQQQQQQQQQDCRQHQQRRTQESAATSATNPPPAHQAVLPAEWLPSPAGPQADGLLRPPPQMHSELASHVVSVCEGQDAEAALVGATFAWGSSATRALGRQACRGGMGQQHGTCLQDISLCIPRGKLTVVVGDVSGGRLLEMCGVRWLIKEAA